LVNISASKITPETMKNEYNVRLAANWVILIISAELPSPSKGLSVMKMR
jgi:hypothetical protein